MKADHFTDWLIERKGGSGSGHWGHAGRPGERGGSKPKDGFSGGLPPSFNGNRKLYAGALAYYANAKEGEWKLSAGLNHIKSNLAEKDKQGNPLSDTFLIQSLLESPDIDNYLTPEGNVDRIAAENGNGSFTSELFFVPMTVLGGQPVTYLEYFNYDTPNGAVEMAKLFAPGDTYYTTDNGRFLWHKKPPTNFCVQLLVKTEPRLILLTPYLGARLTNIVYFPVYHERSPFTTSGYFVDGGQTHRDAYSPSYYSPTA